MGSATGVGAESKGNSLTNPYTSFGYGPPAPLDASSSLNGKVYKVKPGDTLSSIAKANGVTPEELLAQNPEFTKWLADFLQRQRDGWTNPDDIFTKTPFPNDQKLRIPPPPVKEAKQPDQFQKTAGGGFGNRWDSKSGSSSALDSQAPATPVSPEEMKKILADLPEGKVKELLKKAMAEVGTRESGDNAGAITKYTGGTTGLPWCAKFISWVFRQAGMPLAGGDQWAVASIKASMQRFLPPDQLHPGMAAIFNSFSHIELVASELITRNGVKGYMTVGGNTTLGSGQGVAYKFRPLSELQGGGVPAHT